MSCGRCRPIISPAIPGQSGKHILSNLIRLSPMSFLFSICLRLPIQFPVSFTTCSISLVTLPPSDPFPSLHPVLSSRFTSRTKQHRPASHTRPICLYRTSSLSSSIHLQVQPSVTSRFVIFCICCHPLLMNLLSRSSASLHFFPFPAPSHHIRRIPISVSVGDCRSEMDWRCM